MFYKFILVVFMVFLSGCVASFPQSIPTAMIRFTANVPVIIKSMCARDNFIKQGLIKNEYISETSPVKMYGTRSDKNNEIVERLIPADRTLLFRVRWGHAAVSLSSTQITQCDAVFSFMPRPYEQYQADYVRAANSCHLKMYKLSEKNGALEKTEVAVKFYTRSEDTDPVCRRET